jgi:hypothetical protein
VQGNATHHRVFGKQLGDRMSGVSAVTAAGQPHEPALLSLLRQTVTVLVSAGRADPVRRIAAAWRAVSS